MHTLINKKINHYLRPKLIYIFFIRFSRETRNQIIVYKIKARNTIKSYPDLDEIMYLNHLIKDRNLNYGFLFFLRKIFPFLIVSDWLLEHSFRTERLKQRLKQLIDGEIANNLLRKRIRELIDEKNKLKFKIDELESIIKKAKIDWYGDLKPIVEFFAHNKFTHINTNPPIREAKTANIVNAIQLIFEEDGKENSIFKKSTIESYLKPSLYE